jgi:hypothetical protein
MDFKPRKLPKEAASKMRVCPVDTVSPFALMPAPVYALMKLNEKLVSVKAPLDFFTPEELQRFKSFKLFYFQSFVDSIAPVRQAARTVLSLLSTSPKAAVSSTGGATPGVATSKADVGLLPAPYEISDAVLRILAPLWGPTVAIEPFFAAVFTNELCELIPGDVLLAARDKSVKLYEDGILISGWAVFLALHLGYCNLEFLNKLRSRVFSEVSSGVELSSDYVIMDELLESARKTILLKRFKLVSLDSLLNQDDRNSQKLAGRLKRIWSSLVNEDAPLATIHGEGGFADA